MTAPTYDFLENYLAGLAALLNGFDRSHSQYLDVLTFQQRLAENIYTVRLFGDTETLRENRSEIIARLNALTLSVLHISFNELCGIGDRYKPVLQQDKNITWSSVSKGLSLTAWPRFLEIDADYQGRRNQLLQTILSNANQITFPILGSRQVPI